MDDERKFVPVCDHCKRASCIQGEFYCGKYKTAGIVTVDVEALKRLALESPHYWENTNDR